MPPAPGLNNNSLRQFIRVSIGGDTLRVKFSNDFGTSPVTLNSVKIAASARGSAILAATTKELRFGGKAAITLGANSSAYFYFGQTPATLTGHPGSRTTSYLRAGDRSTAGCFSGSASTEHGYTLNTVEVKAPSSTGAVAILGNSIPVPNR